MALTEFQRAVCRLLADNRIRSGESYVAGAAALNELLRAPRISRDVDLFHDTQEARAFSWPSDRQALERAGYEVQVVRERPAFVEARVLRASDSAVVQWVHDSAYRFFPLLRNLELATRSNRYSEDEIRSLEFEGEAPTAAGLSRRFKDALAAGREIVARLPGEEAGKAVLTREGRPFRGGSADLKVALASGGIVFHAGSIRGAFPRLVS